MTAQVKIEADDYLTELKIKQSEYSSWIGIPINTEIAELIIDAIEKHYGRELV